MDPRLPRATSGDRTVWDGSMTVGEFWDGITHNDWPMTWIDFVMHFPARWHDTCNALVPFVQAANVSEGDDTMVRRRTICRVFDWVYPLMQTNLPSDLAVIRQLTQSPWMHLDVLDVRGAETRLRMAHAATPERRFFLVRPSYADPLRAPFSVSSIASSGLIQHSRITRQLDPHGQAHFTMELALGTDARTAAFGNLVEFVNKLVRPIEDTRPGFGLPCPKM